VSVVCFAKRFVSKTLSESNRLCYWNWLRLPIDICVFGICPWECLEIQDPATNEHADSFFGICELVKPTECVGCLLCEEVCIKDAIRVESPVLLELAEAAD
jgi:NAD-dependent dihydropyrimidine dehydrogenase PreA subunit